MNKTCKCALLMNNMTYFIEIYFIFLLFTSFSLPAQMSFATRFYEGWRDLMDNKSDPRTSDWFLMSSPFPTILISLSYALFVKVCTRK